MSENSPHTDPLFDAFHKGLNDFKAEISDAQMDADWNLVKSKINPLQTPANWSGLKGVSVKSIGIGAAGIATITTAIVLLTSKPNTDNENLLKEEIKNTEQTIDDQNSTSIPQEEITNFKEEVQIDGINQTEDGESENVNSTEMNLPESSNTSIKNNIPAYPDKLISAKADQSKKITSQSEKWLIDGAVSFSDTFICLGDMLSISCYQPESSSGIRIYLVLPGNDRQIINGEVHHKFYKPGEYMAQIIYARQSEEVIRKQRIKVFALPQAEFSYDYNSGYTVKFNNHSAFIDSSSWLFGDGNTSFERSPVHYYSHAGNYQVTLTVKSPDGCINDRSKFVEVQNDKDKIEPANFFSPNGDGKNDYFLVEIDDIDLFQLHIMDRNGRTVFETNNKNEKWDGTDIKTKKQCLDGNYFYILSYKYTGKDKPEKKSGTIYLKR